jgi:hypothetical protein
MSTAVPSDVETCTWREQQGQYGAEDSVDSRVHQRSDPLTSLDEIAVLMDEGTPRDHVGL